MSNMHDNIYPFNIPDVNPDENTKTLWLLVKLSLRTAAPEGLKLRTDFKPWVQQRLDQVSAEIPNDQIDKTLSALHQFAVARGVDTTFTDWLLSTIIEAALDHPDLNLRSTKHKSKGKEPKDWLNQFEELHDFYMSANRLRAVLQCKSGKHMSNAELARAMASRNKSMAGQKLIENARYYEKKLTEHKDLYQELYERAIPSGLVPVPRKYRLQRNRQQHTNPYNWAPSTEELDGCPGWQSEFQKIKREQFPKIRWR
jgi:hypothetical protein